MKKPTLIDKGWLKSKITNGSLEVRQPLNIDWLIDFSIYQKKPRHFTGEAKNTKMMAHKSTTKLDTIYRLL